MESGPRKARLVGQRALTADTFEHTFEMVEPTELRFRAGQFLSIGCGAGPDGEPIRRSYSIASPSSDRTAFALVVKRIPGGAGSAFFASLTPGAEIEFTGPMGFFVLELSHRGDVVFGATGTGIAPVLPMLRELEGRPESGRILLYWGLRHADDRFYEEQLAALAARNPRLRWEVCLSRPPEGSAQGPHGRITAPILASASELHHPTYYLVGNGDMVKDLRRQLQERGIDRKRQIRTEAFFEAQGSR
jgi:CDP-4-dehydro-6-deoxyglucose reductase